MHKQLLSIIEIIKDNVKTEKIILLPVAGFYRCSLIPQQLPSYYFLILTREHLKPPIFQLERLIEKECKGIALAHIILHDIYWFNERLVKLGHFYPELASGHTIYDHNRIRLADRVLTDVPTIQQFLRHSFQCLFAIAQQCLQNALLSWENGIADMDALSQSAWHTYTAVEIVFTGVNPETHDLLRLRRSTARFSADLAIVFPNHSQKERKLLERLHKKSMNKRMREINPVPTKEYEGYLKRIEDLHMIFLLVCQEYINSISYHPNVSVRAQVNFKE